MNVTLVPRDKLVPDPKNPRKTDISPEQIQQLADSIKEHGIQVPLIGFPADIQPLPECDPVLKENELILIVDGFRRWLAVQQTALTHLPMVILPERPSEDELLLVQLVIVGQREGLNPIDECEAFQRLMRLKNWSASELAAHLHIHPSEVSRALALAKLSDDEQALVRTGRLSKSAGYALSRMTGDERALFATKAVNGAVTRDQLLARTRKKSAADQVAARRVTCHFTGGSLCVQTGEPLNLADLIERLEQVVKACRKARSQGLDIKTALGVLKDQSRSEDGRAAHGDS